MISIFWILLLLHPVHETVAEIEWNSKSNRLEVGLRLDVEDEQWIKKRLEGGEKPDVWALTYLRDRFRIADKPAEGKIDPTTYHWIGRDQDGAHAWWYFEIEPADGRPAVWIDDRLLFDREPDYLNRILILGQTPPRAINVTSRQSKVELESKGKSDSPLSTTNETDVDSAPLPPTELQ